MRRKTLIAAAAACVAAAALSAWLWLTPTAGPNHNQISGTTEAAHGEGARRVDAAIEAQPLVRQAADGTPQTDGITVTVVDAAGQRVPAAEVAVGVPNGALTL